MNDVDPADLARINQLAAAPATLDADDIRRLKRLAERADQILDTTKRDQAAAAAYRYLRTLLAWFTVAAGAGTAAYTALDQFGMKWWK